MTAPSISISGWKARESGTLRGFFSAGLPSGLELHELMLHHRDGSWWLSFPSKPMLGKDGTALRDPDGKIRYGTPLMSIAGKARERFTQAVLDALRLAQPEVFAETEAEAS